MNFVKLTVRGPQHIAPPDMVVKDVLSLGSWPFPPLDTLVEFPVFRPDGTLIDRPGYDAATWLAYVPNSHLKIPPIPEEPTIDEIINALVLLDEAIGEFPYENKASYAHALGLLLTPIIRQSIHGHVPLALIDATRPGTGRKAAMMTAP